MGCVLAATGEQVPTLPSTLHAEHWPEHGESQQNPSMQLPVVHELPCLQQAPLSRGPLTQVLVQSHTKPPTQSTSLLHFIGHSAELPSHTRLPLQAGVPDPPEPTLVQVPF